MSLKSSKVIILSIIICFGKIQAQDIVDLVVDFDRATTWQKSLETAKSEGRPIFVDVYTNWCAPCKMMDKDVFTDDRLSTYLNRYYTAIKVDADQVEQSFVSSYAIGSYPTFLFLSPDGSELYRHIGSISKHDLLAKSQEVIQYWDNKDLIDGIDYDNHHQYSIEEIKTILSVSSGFSFPNKVNFAKRLLLESHPITDEVLLITMDQLAAFDEQTHKLIAPMVGQFLPSVVLYDRIGHQKIKWRNEMTSLMDQRMQVAIIEGSFLKFEKAIAIHLLMGNVYDRDLERYYNNFYRRNNLDKYAIHAEQFVNKHIIANTPEKIKLIDESRYEEYEELRAQNGGSSSSGNSDIDYFTDRYKVCRSVADQLLEFSSDFYAFYEDEQQWSLAEKWAAQAYAYFPYDLKYYENHIVILEALKKYEKAKSVEILMKKSPYYEEMLQIKKQRQQSDLNLSLIHI